MAIFRLLHLSDLHFSVRPDWENPFEKIDAIRSDGESISIAKELLSLLRPRKESLSDPSGYDVQAAICLSGYIDTLLNREASQPISAIIITGDLSTTGLSDDLLVASDFFVGNARGMNLPSGTLRPLLEWQVPWILLPGNHDRYHNRFFKPDSRRFEFYFGANWDFQKGTARQGGEGIRFSFLRDKDNGEMLAIVSADFSLRDRGDADSTLAAIGQGYAYVDRIQGLRDATLTARELQPNCAIIWAFHYPPGFNEINQNLLLKDEGKALSLADEMKVPIILAGHTHEARGYNIENTEIRVLCAGSATCSSYVDTNSIQEISISVNNGTIDLNDSILIKHVFPKQLNEWIKLKPNSLVEFE